MYMFTSCQCLLSERPPCNSRMEEGRHAGPQRSSACRQPVILEGDCRQWGMAVQTEGWMFQGIVLKAS